jgi:phage terminase large subunit
MKENNYRRYAVAGLGEWGIADGLIFENWEVKPFDKDSLGIADNTEWQYRHFFGLDYGYTNDPTAFVCFAVNPVAREILIYDEHYETKMLNSQIAEMIKKKGYAKERIRADCAEPKSNEDLRRMGIGRIMPSQKGKDSIINGITRLQEYKIIVHPACRHTIAELSAYCWKKDKAENGLNEPEDKNNHLMDALRYAFYDVRFFRPENPNKRKRYTAEERYAERTAITAEEINSNWF